MRWLTEAFEPAFMQRALLAGLMTAAVTSVVGTWVVIRGLAFMGDALAHGVIPGIAVAVIWGFNPLLGAMVAALVMGGAVSLVSSRTNLREDTSIGLLFVGMLALGNRDHFVDLRHRRDEPALRRCPRRDQRRPARPCSR